MERLRVLVLGLTLVGAMASPLAAAPKDPCESDARRYCRDVVPDDAKIAACLKANQSKLSAACKASYATRAKAKAL